MRRHRPHDGEALGGDLQPVLAKKLVHVPGHGRRLGLILDYVKN
jgi:hypothetical protein